MMAAVLMVSINGLNAASTLSPMPTKQKVSMFECWLSLMKQIVVPAMAHSHTNENNPQPQ